MPEFFRENAVSCKLLYKKLQIIQGLMAKWDFCKKGILHNIKRRSFILWIS